MDLAGDGQLDLVHAGWPACRAFMSTTTPMAGVTFQPFTSRLNRDTRDPNLKFDRPRR